MAVLSYLDMSRKLEEELTSAAVGYQVASENELAQRFRVSRLTARAALQDLERRHVVRRVQGRGTFVTRRLDYLVTDEGPPSFTRIVRAAGAEPKMTIDSIETRPAVAEERAALKLPGRAKVIDVRRRRWIDGEAVACGHSVLPASLLPGFEDKLAEVGSLFTALDEGYDLKPQRAWFRCQVVPAPEEIVAALELRGRPELFFTEGRLESANLKRPVEINEGWLRADIFNVVLEIGSFR